MGCLATQTSIHYSNPSALNPTMSSMYIHGDEHDEWRNERDIVPLPRKPEAYQPFELHREVAYQIKLALDSRGRRDPQVRIEVPLTSSFLGVA